MNGQNNECDKNTPKLTVFYDPHKKGEGKITKQIAMDLGQTLSKSNPEPCHPKPQVKGCDLSWVDIVIVDERGKKAKVLCEIEEWGGPVSPKIFIQDIVSLLLSDQVKVRGNFYRLDKNSRIVLGLSHYETKEAKERVRKLEEVIRKKVKPTTKDLTFTIVLSTSDQLKSAVIREILEILRFTPAERTP